MRRSKLAGINCLATLKGGMNLVNLRVVEWQDLAGFDETCFDCFCEMPVYGSRLNVPLRRYLFGIETPKVRGQRLIDGRRKLVG